MNRRMMNYMMCGVALAIAAANVAPALGQADLPLGTGITFQGMIQNGGAPVNEEADMRFSLWTAALGGAQLGSTIEFSNDLGAIGPPVDVVNGLFTAELDFGVEHFDGEDVYLRIEVRVPAGIGGWTALDPRQRLAPTPYALQTRGLFTDDALQVGVGETAPLSRLHVQQNDIGLGAADLLNEDLVVENGDAGIGVYSTDSGTRGSALHFGQFSGGVLANKWSIFQNVTQDDLRFKWGTNANWTNNPTLMVLSGSRGPTLDLFNNDGSATVSLIGDPTGEIHLRDFSETLRTRIGAEDAEVSLFSGTGAPLARLWGTIGDEEGTLELFSEEDGLHVRLEATPFGGGFIDTWDAGGNRAISLQSDAGNGGALAWLFDRNERASIVLAADVGNPGGSRIGMQNLAGSETLEFLGGGTGNSGEISVRNDFENTTIHLLGDQDVQNSGFIGILNRTGTNNFNAIALDALDEFDTGARMVMRCNEGTTTVEIDAQDANHGEIALWDCAGNRTFRVFGNTMTIYNDSGSATWSINGNGAKNAIVATENFGQRLVYTMESPEVWFEDVGSGVLQNGVARIDLDPIFLETVTVDERHPLRVFVTLTGDCSGVFVEKGADHFIVRELGGGRSNASFDYRVMAKRVGFEDTRLQEFSEAPPPHSDEFISPVTAEPAPTVDGAPAPTAETASRSRGE